MKLSTLYALKDVDLCLRSTLHSHSLEHQRRKEFKSVGTNFDGHHEEGYGEGYPSHPAPSQLGECCAPEAMLFAFKDVTKLC